MNPRLHMMRGSTHALGYRTTTIEDQVDARSYPLSSLCPSRYHLRMIGTLAWQRPLASRQPSNNMMRSRITLTPLHNSSQYVSCLVQEDWTFDPRQKGPQRSDSIANFIQENQCSLTKC